MERGINLNVRSTRAMVARSSKLSLLLPSRFCFSFIPAPLDMNTFSPSIALQSACFGFVAEITKCAAKMQRQKLKTGERFPGVLNFSFAGERNRVMLFFLGLAGCNELRP